MFVDNEISQVAGAMHAMSLHDQQQQQQQFTPSFTLASIGTVFLEDVKSGSISSSTSASFSPSPSPALEGSLSPMSSTSSLPDYDIVTPEQTPVPDYRTLSRPPSLESLLSECDSFGKPPSSALGGGALYALIGARIWLPAHEMRTVVDRAPRLPTVDVDASDFRSALEAEIERFGPEMWVFNQARVPGSHVGFNDDVNTYHNIVKPETQTGAELADGPLAGAAYLHVSPPYSSSGLVQLLSKLEATGSSWAPKVVFVPNPASCHPGEKVAFELAAQRVHVLSPTYEDLFSLYGIETPDTIHGIGKAVEEAINHILVNVGVGADGNGTLVVRCGPHGMYIGTRWGGISWTPCYYPQDSLRVKDLTGACDAFLGGFVAGLKITDGNPYDAALYGSVSASFVVEQYGLPCLTPSPTQSPIGSPLDFHPQICHTTLPSPVLAIQNAARARCLRAATGREMWNSDRPQRRLELLRLRAAM